MLNLSNAPLRVWKYFCENQELLCQKSWSSNHKYGAKVYFSYPDSICVIYANIHHIDKFSNILIHFNPNVYVRQLMQSVLAGFFL